MRSSPQLKSDGQRVNTDPRPPRGLIAIGVQIAVMKSAYGDGEFVADFAAECARLGKANVMRFGRHPAADNARLQGDELAVLFVAEANGLRRNATTARVALSRYEPQRSPLLGQERASPRRRRTRP